MVKFLAVFVFVILPKNFINCQPDLIPQAITVYRNPEFFKNLNYGANYNRKPTSTPPGKTDHYKYSSSTEKYKYTPTTERYKFIPTTERYKYSPTTQKYKYLSTTQKYKYSPTTQKYKYSPSTQRYKYSPTTQRYKYSPTTESYKYTRTTENYQYPGETKKPNPPPPSTFEVNFDNSPEFHHEPRDIFVDTTYRPPKRKGPYGPRYRSENNLEESSNSQVETPSEEDESDEDESKNEFQNYNESDGGSEEEDDPVEYVSVLSPNPEEEFKSYHEPLVLAKAEYIHDGSQRKVSSSYNKPYPYSRNSPVLYEAWKHYTYPKIHAKDHVKSDSSMLYSEEPASNAFDADRYTTYFRHDEDPDDSMDLFANNEYKNLGSDTKHIYKKLLTPKKFKKFFKLHSKPKVTKLKLKVKKGNVLNKDWYNSYPFNF